MQGSSGSGLWHCLLQTGMLAFTSYPGIIPGSEDEVAWLYFIPRELGAHITPCLWMGLLGQSILIQ